MSLNNEWWVIRRTFIKGIFSVETDFLKAFVAAGGNINAKDGDGRTILHVYIVVVIEQQHYTQQSITNYSNLPAKTVNCGIVGLLTQKNPSEKVSCKRKNKTLIEPHKPTEQQQLDNQSENRDLIPIPTIHPKNLLQSLEKH